MHLVVWFFWFFWCLCRFGDYDFTKHWQAPKKTKKIKPLDAPNIDRHQKKQKIQQLLRSGPIVPGNFSFFLFFGACAGLVHLVVCLILFFMVPVQVWWLWLHKTLTGTRKNKKNQTTRCTKHRQAPKKQKKNQQLLRCGPIVPGNFSFLGACAGLVHLVVCFVVFFFGACAGLVTLTSQNIDRHQKKQKQPNH